MRAVLIGASRLAMATVTEMLEAGHEVVVIDKDERVIEDLEADFDCSFYCGDGAKPSVLEDVDPSNTDLLLCLSDDDTSNVLAAVVAKSLEFDRVVLRLDDPDLLSICEQLGLENVIVPDKRIACELLSFFEGERDKPE
ncbi:NAD-binding protein [Pseudohalioglobus lutimaris]|uniref:TrkA family potassium uptake protein n=1 Tax=Pseudohalioglobus lutimaris TaxID=1737061 RepID=A0A2N5X848_9GAMM|nr:NAD-binding protein [Pseudohalioglobus lutimaris]PLW70663.1 TrkA family potassium uptake protein [Pseudohalioglobus lutimaris]